MMQTFHTTVKEKDDGFYAQCLEIDVIGFGGTKQEALMDLRESLLLYFEELRPFMKIYLQVVET